MDNGEYEEISDSWMQELTNRNIPYLCNKLNYFIPGRDNADSETTLSQWTREGFIRLSQ